MAIALCALLAAPTQVFAQSGPTLPHGGAFVAGTGSIGQPFGGSLNITQSSARGVINWQSFSIGAGGRVLINNGTGATLSRVTGGTLSSIDGLLKATGSLYLINPNGVILGGNSDVLTNGSFLASTRDIDTALFMAGGAMTASGTSAGDVVNRGAILARDGDVILFGHSVENSGFINAPQGTATLTIGNRVLLTTIAGPAGIYVAPDTDTSGTLTQTGRIQAAAAALKAGGGDIYTLAGNRTGLISATGTKTINGEVWLSAPNGEVVADGGISAQNADGTGGKVVVNGADVKVASGARISAQGSSGGTVLIGTSQAGGIDLANSTSLADGASIVAGGSAGGGLVETSGHAVSIGKATVSAGQGGLWRVDPTDLTIDTAAASTIASTLNGGTNVSESTTATTATGTGTQSAGQGDIDVAAPISWTGTGALNLSAYHDLNLNAAISGSGGFTGVAGNAVTANANVSASNVRLTAGTGNMTLASGVTVTGATGVTLQTSGQFVNNAGATALSAGSGNWLVYSANPSADTTGGLTPNFLQYGAAGGATPATNGNGLLYSIAPTLSVALSGTVEKTYDGTTAATTFTGANSTVSGLVNSDTATVTGTYASKNAGSGITVTASNITATHGGVPVYGYGGTTPSVSAGIGMIDPATLTASIIGTPTKTYNATTTATLTSSNYQLNGFASGESATVNQPSSVGYDSAEAGARTVSATFSSTNFVPGSGTSLSNYVLPTSATGAGLINQAPLLISGVLATDKTYDRTTADTLNSSAAALYGVIGSDNVGLVTSGAAGTFSAANAGSGLSVSASGFTLSGTKASDYALVQPSGLTASISQAALSISGVSATDKQYDATNAATLNTSGAALSGVLSGDVLMLGTGSASGTFATSDVGTGIAVTASGFSLSGAAASNYRMAQPSGLSADITAKPLSLTIISTPTKTYNGDAGAVIDSSGFNLTGFVGGQSATVGQTSHVTYDTANAGTQGVTATLSVSDYTAAPGTTLSNYVLPGSATGVGLINQAPVTIAIQGNPTKTYDGSATGTLNSSNYLLNGFLAGQGATVTQTAGLYDSANAGSRQISATLSASNLTPVSGTLLSNYSLPTIATGFGTIVPAPIAGSVYAAIINNPTKSYDGTTAATLTSSDFQLTGFAQGQGATVTQTVGNYASKNVGVQAVTASLAAPDFTPDGGTILSNYTLPTEAYGTGTINPALLTATIIGTPTKVYNSTTSAAVTGANFNMTGLAPGETISVGNSVQASYDMRQAGSRTVTANISVTDFTAGSGTLLSNYVLPTSATGAGLITQAPISILGVSAVGKVYDTTTAATLSTGGANMFGVVGSDAVTLSSAGATGVFASPNAGGGVAVSASGFTISGSDAANYQLFQPVGLAATIYKAQLSLTGVSAVDKIYDNTTTASLSTGGAALSGVLSPDAGHVAFDGTNAAAAFSSVNVGNNLAVTAAGFSLTGTQSSNYSLNQPTGLTANITAAPLTANIIGNPTKVYDGSTSTTLTASNYQLTGFVTGQSATLPQSAGAQYSSPNAGSEPITSTLVSSDFLPASGTNLSNYILPVHGNGTGTITPAPLTASIVGNPTKTYDTNTAATLTSSNYALQGFVSGQSATVAQSVGAYDVADAGSRTVSATLSAGDFTGTGPTNLSNYVLPTSATGTGTIDKAALQVVNVLGTNRSYNGGFGDTLNVSSASVSGLLGSDTVTLNTGGGAGTFVSKDVATGIGVTATGFTMSGGQSADYTLAQPTGLSADITQALLTLTNVTRQYNSTTGLPGSASAYTLSGMFNSDAVGVDTSGITGSYADKNVGTGKNVSLAGLALNGAQGADYTIASSLTNSAIGTITKAPLTVAGAAAQNKVYDATTSAALNNTSAALSGLFSGDAVTLDTTQSIGVFADKNAGNGKTVTASNYTISGADTGNYNFTQPTGLTANITPYSGISLASVTKTYSGDTSLPGSSAAYVLSGLLGSDSVQVATGGITGSYASGNVGSNLSVSLSGLALTGTDHNNYSIGSTISNGNIGIINPKALTAGITGDPTKTYDTTNSATLAASNYTLSGFVTGENATITQTSGTYTSSNAAASVLVSTSLASGDFSPTGGTLLTNYTLPTSASGTGTINKAPLTITGVSATNKVYNTSSADPLNVASAALSGVLGSDNVTLNTAGAIGTFASPNVASGVAVTASAFAIGGTQAADYTLAQPTGLSADITQAAVSLASVTKVYTATNSAIGAGVTYTLGGIMGSDSVSLDTANLAGTYSTKNVGTGLSINMTGLALTGGQASNYSIIPSVSNSLIGIITQAPLSVTGALAVGKVYDGTASAAMNNGSTSLSGVLGVDVVTLASPSTGVFSSANAGTWAVTPGAFTISGTDAGNYNLTQPSGFSATITRAPLSVAIINSPAKTYNGATAATLASTNYSLTGFIGSQGATVGQTSGTYDSANAGARTVTATLSAGNFTATGGAILSNYVLPTTASGAGLINPKTLTAAIVNNPAKTYSGDTTALLASTNYAVSGFVAGQGATVTQPSGTYNVANAGSRTVTAALTPGDFTATGGANFANYTLPTTASGAGTINPETLTAGIIGDPTKTYDGGTTATLGSSNYTLTGFIGGDGATVSQTAGTYDVANAGSRTVTAALTSGNFTATGGANLSNYTLPTTASGAGTINQKTLTAAITNDPAKTYDGGISATLVPSNYTLTGFVGGQSATVTQTSGSYDAADAGSRTVTATLSAGNLTATGGANFANYVLPTTASGAGVINAKALTATITGDPTKIYDDATGATLTSGNYALNGFAAGQGATVNQTAGTYDSADAGLRTITAALTSGNFTATGGANFADYTLPTTASGPGTIDQKILTAAIMGDPAKTYNGTTAATLASGNYSLTGFIGSQGATVTQTAGTYDLSDAGARTVTATLTSGNFTGTGGANLANYALPTTASGAGVITQQALTAAIINDPAKTYDGNTTASLASTNYALTGFITGQGATVTQTAGTYDLSDAGARTVTATLTAGNFTGTGGANLANYALPTTASGAGVINQQTLTAAIVNNPAKTYDGNTTANLASTNYTLNGFVTGQGATVTQTAGTYDSADAGSRTVNALLGSNDFTQNNGTNLANYVLPTAASGAGSISQRALTAAIVNNPAKTYDGNTAANLASTNYTLNGFVTGQGATVTQTAGSYDISDAGSRTVTATLGSNDFTQNAGTNLANYALPTTASGAGIISQQGLTAAIVNNPAKTYDGNTTANLAPTNYTLSGFVTGQGATVTQTAGTYDSADAGSRTVNALLGSNDFTQNSGTNLANYALPTTAAGAGTIGQQALTAAIVNNPVKTYDGNTTATLASSNYTLNGFVTGQGATVTQTTGTYDLSDAGSRTVTASLGSNDFTQSSGTNLANYVLPTAASGAGTISQQALTAAIVNNPAKTYDGNTTASLASGNYALTGFIGSQGATVTQTAGTYDLSDAGARTVTATLGSNDFTQNSGTNLANYALPTTAAGAGTIGQQALTAAIVNNPTKTYNGNTAATLAPTNYSLTGFVTGQGATVTQPAGTYDLSDAGSRTVTASLGANDFTQNSETNLANYVLPTGASGAGAISQQALTAAIVNSPTKTYDGSTAATLASSDYALNGFVTGQGATVTQTAGTYDSADAGTRTIMVSLGSNDFTQGSGTNLANYALPTTASGAGTIGQQALTAAIVNNPTKTYNGNTAATLASSNYTLNGFVTGQGATVTQTVGTYDLSDAGTRTVTASLGSNDFTQSNGTNLANYALPTTAAGAGTIGQQALTAAIVNDPTKTYNSNTAATLASTNYALNGFVPGQGATVTQTAGTYDSADAGTRTVTAALGSNNFIQDNGTNLANYALPTTASGAGTISQQALTAAIVNNPAKTYDGNTAATLASSNYTLNGFVPGQGATITQTAGTYDLSDAGSRTVTAALGSNDFTQNSGTNLANYVLPTTASGAGTIGQQTLTAAIITNPAKTYDSTTAATLAPSNYTLNGFVTGQGATVTQTAGTYDSADAGTRTVNASLGSNDFSQNNGTNLANYVLPTTASGAGTISQQTLTAEIVNSPAKTYDGNTTASLASTNYTLSGFVPGQGATVTQTAGVYDSADAGARTVTATLGSNDFTQNSGTNLANYALPTTASGAGVISQQALTAAIVNNPAKTYNGNTVATLVSSNYTLNGFVTGQGATVTQTGGTYDSADAGTRTVNVSLGSNDFTQNSGTNLANYALPTTASGAGTINQQVLTAAVVNNPAKTYDSNTAATLAPTNYSLTGFVTGQGATVTQTSGTYNSADAGSRTVTASLGSNDFTQNAGTNLSNYVLPTTASGAGTIDQKILTAAITGSSIKTYDGATTATLAPNDYTLTGFVTGQGATITQTAANYDSSDAGSRTVTAALGGYFAPNSGTTLANYVLPTTVSGTGIINQKTLTAAITEAPSKTYDNNTAATLAPGNYTVTGFVAGQGATVTQTAGAYDLSDAGSRTVTATLGSGDFTQNAGTNLSNYVLPATASGAGTIDQKTVTAAISGNPVKTYDSTAAASLNSGNYTLDGFVTGQGATVNQTAGAYDLADAGTRTITTALGSGNLTPDTGTNLANYILPAAASGSGTINRKALTAAITGNPVKTYDGTTTALLNSGNYTLSGLVAGQDATVNQTAGSYDLADAGQRTLAATLTAGDFTAVSGTNLGNYLLPVLATGTGSIAPRLLSASIIGVPARMADGTILAILSAGNFSLTGFIPGQGATVTQSTGTYDAAAAGQRIVTATLNVQSFAPSAGTQLSNYLLPLSAFGAAVITPAVRINAPTLSEAIMSNMTIRNMGSSSQIAAIASRAVFAAAVPRIYIPYPSPSALSTWQNNGFGSLPTILGATTASSDISANGDQATSSGPPVINSTEQILLQGGKNKSWHLALPATESKPASAESGR